jgi:hypothetical protein
VKLSTLFDTTVQAQARFLEETIHCHPIQRDDGTVWGVLEFAFFGDLSSVQDLKVFCSTFRKMLGATNLPGITESFDVREWVANEEKGPRTVPARLALSSEKGKICFRYQLNVFDWEGIGAFQLVFRIVKKFGLMEAFEIGNSQFFNFLDRVRSGHSQIPFPNWFHAIDVFQFVAVLLVTTHLDQLLSKIDMLGLFVAALCHDLGHDGFQRVQKASATSGHGQLFALQSVMETEACWNTLAIIGDEDSAIFTGMSAQQQQQIWEVIIDCILATDLAQHEAIMSKFKALLEEGPFEPEEDTGHRTILMQMLIKCADFGGLARPFEIAKERCNWIAEEFFYVGALSGSSGVQFGIGTRREHVDKQGSAVSVLEYVAKPIFELITRYSQSAGFLLEQVESNMAQLRKLRP